MKILRNILGKARDYLIPSVFWATGITLLYLTFEKGWSYIHWLCMPFLFALIIIVIEKAPCLGFLRTLTWHNRKSFTVGLAKRITNNNSLFMYPFLVWVETSGKAAYLKGGLALLHTEFIAFVERWEARAQETLDSLDRGTLGRWLK